MYKIGKTLVEVWQKTISKNGSESQKIIHSGVLTAIRVNKLGNPAFLQLFNFNIKKGTGAYNTKEFFAISAPLVWCKLAGELKYNVDTSEI